jgi:DNA gyrase subunit B
MPELIEKGFLYIAQPPLFGVKKGKKIRYMKEQSTLNEFVIENGIDSLTVKSASGIELAGQPLYHLAGRLRSHKDHLNRIDRRCDKRVIAAAVREGQVRAETFNQREDVEKARERLEKVLIERYPDLLPLSVTIDENEEDGLLLRTKFRPGATNKPCVLSKEIADTGEYHDIVSIEEDVASIGALPYTAVPAKGEETQLHSAEELDLYLYERGRKGLDVGRYKGLGEMNADQLWETTMNPDGRTLLQVEVKDPVRAEEIFSVLMGDQVEPRRKFIEDNALNVQNLDI